MATSNVGVNQVQIQSLFDATRFPCGASLIPILLYAPLGLVIAVLRLFLGLHAYVIACVLPKSLPLRSHILRALCGIVGIVVCVDDKRGEKHTQPSPLIVSNHICLLDHLAIDLIIPNITPSVWDIPSGLAWLLGYSDMDVRKGTEALVERIQQHTEKSSLPVLVFPEGGTTNGAVGLLKFSVWPFSLQQSIQPVALTVERPFLIPITVSPLGSRWWSDMFWFLFSPYTVFKLQLLPVMHAGETGDPADFCARTELCIATRLCTLTTQHTDKDKVEYVKRRLFEARGDLRDTQAVPLVGDPTIHNEALPVNDIQLLSSQVQTVLPDVPLQAIQSDIEKTRDVDTTITNFLEGKVAYKATTDNDAPSLSDSKVFGATQFSRNASTRQLSFRERKELMMEWARECYKQKHGL